MKTKTKCFTADQIRTKFDNMSKDLKIKILYEAIDIMQQYNGRSRFLCIAMAMGYENLAYSAGVDFVVDALKLEKKGEDWKAKQRGEELK